MAITGYDKNLIIDLKQRNQLSFSFWMYKYDNFLVSVQGDDICIIAKALVTNNEMRSVKETKMECDTGNVSFYIMF